MKCIKKDIPFWIWGTTSWCLVSMAWSIASSSWLCPKMLDNTNEKKEWRRVVRDSPSTVRFATLGEDLTEILTSKDEEEEEEAMKAQSSASSFSSLFLNLSLSLFCFLSLKLFWSWEREKGFMGCYLTFWERLPSTVELGRDLNGPIDVI